MKPTDICTLYCVKGSWEAALQTKLLKDRVIVRPAYFNETVPVQLSLLPSYLQEVVSRTLILMCRAQGGVAVSLVDLKKIGLVPCHNGKKRLL